MCPSADAKREPSDPYQPWSVSWSGGAAIRTIRRAAWCSAVDASLNRRVALGTGAGNARDGPALDRAAHAQEDHGAYRLPLRAEAARVFGAGWGCHPGLASGPRRWALLLRPAAGSPNGNNPPAAG